MKKRIRKKFHSSSGESIAETLIALLISSLALVMLASMISSTSNILSQSKNAMNNYYTEINKLAEQGESSSDDSAVAVSEGTVEIKDGDGKNQLDNETTAVRMYTYPNPKMVISFHLIEES